jgi:hypothetical protein
MTLSFVVEGAQGEAFHRVDLVFQCEYLEEIPGVKLHGDTIRSDSIGFHCLISTQPLSYPSRLRRQIMNLYEGKPYKRYWGMKKRAIRMEGLKSGWRFYWIRQNG